MKLIRYILNIGTDNALLTEAELPRIRLTNGIILFSIASVFFYILLYLTIFPSRLAAWFNSGLLLLLLLCYPLASRGYYLFSRILYASLFMFQFFFLTVHVFGKDSGIHLFYLTIAPVGFLLFDHTIKRQRYFIYFFSCLSILLFYYAHFFPLTNITFSRADLQFSISVISLILTLFVSSWIFTKEISRVTKKLNILASTDELSGLANRRSFFIHGERIAKESVPFALLLLDLDHFKKINDTHGHPVGDETIRKFSVVVQETLRTNDIFARLGGEEFGIILPRTDENGAKLVAEQIRSRVETMKICIPANAFCSCTVSIGITVCNNKKTDFDTLVLQCDKALYAAKHSGRNRYTLFKQAE